MSGENLTGEEGKRPHRLEEALSREARLTREYAVASSGWDAFVHGVKVLDEAPLSVLLLHALAPEDMTGDPLVDVLDSLTDTIAGWRAVGGRGGGGVVEIDLSDMRLAERRARVVAELLRRDRLAREARIREDLIRIVSPPEK